MSRARVRRSWMIVAAIAVGAALPVSGTAGARSTSPAAKPQTASASTPAQRTLIDNGLHKPGGVGVDAAGDVFVADAYNNRIVELLRGGTQIVLPITITNPSAIAVSAGGDVFAAETNGGRIIELPKGGTAFDLPITGLSTQYGVYGVAVDAAGDVFVADTGNYRIVKLSHAGVQTTVPLNMALPFGVAVDAAGNIYASQAYYGGGVVELHTDGTQTTIGFSGIQGPWGLAVDAAGDAFVADFRTGLIVERSVGGSQSTLAFTGLFEPKGVTVDASGTVYVSDYNSRILAWTPGGTVTTLGFTGLSGPTGVAVDPQGRTYIADDFGNGRVQRRETDGTLIDLGFTGLSGPGGVAVDGAGSVYVASWFTSTITKRTQAGVQTVLPFSGLQQPASVAVDASGNVYVTDTGHARLVELPATGPQVTISTGLTAVAGVAVDGPGNVYVTGDQGRVVRVAPGGAQTTLGFTGLSSPGSVAVDPSGDVFALDDSNNRVVELPAGGTARVLGFTDIFEPWGVAADASGNVFVTAHAPSGGLVELPAGAPDTPLSIRAEAGNRSATVTWAAPFLNGAPISGYVVTPVVGGVDQAPRTFLSTDLTQTVSGLANGTTYGFRVAASNAFGTGPAGTSTVNVTVGAPQRPLGFLTADPGDTTVTLTWWPPEANAAPISGYTITPFVNGVAQTPVPFTGPATARTLTGLTNGTHYRFDVTATNAAGTSVAASTAATIGTPSRPWVFLRAQPGTSDATISWWAPPVNAAPITGYTVTPFIGWIPLPAVTIPPTPTTHTISGLTPGVHYGFKVTARNALGAGGTASTIQTLVGAPTSPPAVTATASSGGADVTWAPPTANAAPLTSFRVTPYIGWIPQVATTVPATQTSATVVGLLPGITYTFHVIASNGIGAGPQSPSSNRVVPR